MVTYLFASLAKAMETKRVCAEKKRQLEPEEQELAAKRRQLEEEEAALNEKKRQIACTLADAFSDVSSVCEDVSREYTQAYAKLL